MSEPREGYGRDSAGYPAIDEATRQELTEFTTINRAELEGLRAKCAELQDALESMVNQHCTYSDINCDAHISDGALSANREAIALLVKAGRLEVVDGKRGWYEWRADV